MSLAYSIHPPEVTPLRLRLGGPYQFEIPVRSKVVGVQVGQKVERFRKAVRAAFEVGVDAQAFQNKLLFEQGGQHDGRNALILELDDILRRFAERRCRRDQRRLQGQAHIPRCKITHSSSPPALV